MQNVPQTLPFSKGETAPSTRRALRDVTGATLRGQPLAEGDNDVVRDEPCALRAGGAPYVTNSTPIIPRTNSSSSSFTV